MGGMANQMFQYAFGLVIGTNKYECSFFDEQDFRKFELGHFNVDVQCVSKTRLWFCKKLFGQHNANVNIADGFFPNSLTQHGFHVGYFQNEKYLDLVRDKLLHDFQLREKLDARNAKLLKEIQNPAPPQESQSVFIHVRRTDYLKYPDVHFVMDDAYYNKAMKHIESHVVNPVYFVFSDDIDWAKKNIKTSHKIKFIDYDNPGYIDFELMKNCHHAIIANSSFSWMAAYLNQNSDKIVVAPKNWFLKNGVVKQKDGISSKYIKI